MRDCDSVYNICKSSRQKKFWFREAEVGTMKEILWNWLGRKIGKILGRVDGGERI